MLAQLKKIVHRSGVYCFYGGGITDMLESAIKFAKALNCRASTQGDSSYCGACKSCSLITKNEFPDMIQIFPDGLSIKFEQIKEAKSRIGYEVSDQNFQVLIIYRAELLTPQSANSLLKLLEDLPRSLTVILLTENKHSILSTLLSRCYQIRFSSVLNENDLSIQISTGSEHPSLVNLLSGAAIEGYKSFNSEDDVKKFEEYCIKVIQWSQSLIKESSDMILFLSSDFATKERVPLIIDLFIIWWRDLLRYRLGDITESIFNFLPEAQESLAKQSYQLDNQKILRSMQTMLTFRDKLAGPVQPQMMLERMVLTVQEDLRNNDKSNRRAV